MQIDKHYLHIWHSIYTLCEIITLQSTLHVSARQSVLKSLHPIYCKVEPLTMCIVRSEAATLALLGVGAKCGEVGVVACGCV